MHDPFLLLIAYHLLELVLLLFVIYKTFGKVFWHMECEHREFVLVFSNVILLQKQLMLMNEIHNVKQTRHYIRIADALFQST